MSPVEHQDLRDGFGDIIKTVEVELCAICHTGPDEHLVAEREGVVHHKFSAEGALEELPKKPAPLKKKKTPAEEIPAQNRPPLPSDPILRFILIQKGLITPEDLLEAEKILQATGMLSTVKDSTP